MIVVKEYKRHKVRILDFFMACSLLRQKLPRSVLLNSAAWAALLVAAWMSYPTQSGESRGFNAVKFGILLLWGAGAFLFAKWRSGVAVGWPLALAGFLAFQYLEATPSAIRQHDVEGHREYIEHLSTHLNLPEVQQGWETWQPPLYYVSAALWRKAFSLVHFADSFRSVQILAAILYLALIVTAVFMFPALGLNNLEAMGALGLLALLPGHVFFAGRINNDVLLPLLGAGLLWATAEFVRTGGQRWLSWLMALLPALLMTKGSSLAVVGGALALGFCSEMRRTGWWRALVRAYLIALPAMIWQVFWWVRTAAQTGNPLYVNAALPDNLRIESPVWRRLLSFDLEAFIGGAFYYDEPMRKSYPTALITSSLYGEYGMQEAFWWSELLRWGCLGVLLVLAAGALVVPRIGLRPVWVTCLVLAGCQTAMTVTYAVQFPFACNQNMRFFAQAFVPLSCLFGLGVGHFWQRGGWLARGALAVILTAFLVGLADFYWHVTFAPT